MQTCSTHPTSHTSTYDGVDIIQCRVQARCFVVAPEVITEQPLPVDACSLRFAIFRVAGFHSI